jgi:hypothetical protein
MTCVLHFLIPLLSPKLQEARWRTIEQREWNPENTNKPRLLNPEIGQTIRPPKTAKMEHVHGGTMST